MWAKTVSKPLTEMEAKVREWTRSSPLSRDPTIQMLKNKILQHTVVQGARLNSPEQSNPAVVPQPPSVVPNAATQPNPPAASNPEAVPQPGVVPNTATQPEPSADTNNVAALSRASVAGNPLNEFRLWNPITPWRRRESKKIFLTLASLSSPGVEKDPKPATGVADSLSKDQYNNTVIS